MKKKIIIEQNARNKTGCLIWRKSEKAGNSYESKAQHQSTLTHLMETTKTY